MNNDNIYNILNNFQKLTPKEEAKSEAKQPVYESVAARGSVLAGVDKIEARLKQEFGESKFSQVSKAIQKTGKSKASADAIAASIGREKLGQKEMTRRAMAGKKKKHMDEGEGTCNECGMLESDCGCEHTNENLKHTGHYGTEYYKTSDFTGDEEPKVKKAKGTGQRGRPKKADSEKSSASLPFSGKNKIGNDPFGRSALPKTKSKVKGRVHRMDEAINYKRVAETHQMTLDEMIECMQRDMMQFRESGECSDLLRDCMEIYTHNKKIADEAIVKPSATDIKFATPAYQRKASGDANWALNQGDFAQKDREDPTTKVGLAQRAKDLGISHNNELHQELDELARLAGITDEGNAFTGKLADTPKGGEFELDGKKFKDTSTTLEDIAQLAGVAVEGKEYGNTDVEDKDTARQYVNAPKEEIEDVNAIIHQGNDLNKEKQQDAKTANRAANPLTKEKTDEAFDPLEALGRKLMKEYESIKISK